MSEHANQQLVSHSGELVAASARERGIVSQCRAGLAIRVHRGQTHGDLVTVIRRWTRRSRHIAALSAVAFFVLGCSGAPSVQPPAAKPSLSATPVTPSAAATPTQTPSQTPRPQVSPFASLSSYLDHRGRVTAALYDARTKQLWQFNPGVTEDTASIVKVEIMGTALWEANESHKALPASEAALMTPMIEFSDNAAATALWNDVDGPTAIEAFDRAIGMTDTVPSAVAIIPGTSLPGWGLTTTTARDEVTLVSKFAYPNKILTYADRMYGLGLMTKVEAGQNWGVTGGVPFGTTVALKNGWLPLPSENNLWQGNSIGWISGHGHNYVLAVLTNENPSEGYGIDTIEAISRAVYRSLGRNR